MLFPQKPSALNLHSNMGNGKNKTVAKTNDVNKTESGELSVRDRNKSRTVPATMEERDKSFIREKLLNAEVIWRNTELSGRGTADNVGWNCKVFLKYCAEESRPH